MHPHTHVPMDPCIHKPMRPYTHASIYSKLHTCTHRVVDHKQPPCTATPMCSTPQPAPVHAYGCVGVWVHWSVCIGVSVCEARTCVHSRASHVASAKKCPYLPGQHLNKRVQGSGPGVKRPKSFERKGFRVWGYGRSTGHTQSHTFWRADCICNC